MRRARHAGEGLDLGGRVDAVVEALDAGGDRFDPATAGDARAVLDRTAERLRLGEEHTVVALGGATGSGKSSLFNALAGLELAEVGVRRPTTATPTACVWGGGGDELLDWLEVPRRHRSERESPLDDEATRSEQHTLDGLVLLDLPDHDSTRVAHRLEVDRLVPLVDLLVWVVDPQKYADDALHARYLRRLAGHEAVLVVVLNQADRLRPEEVDACRADLGRLLAEDGLPAVTVLVTSARTGDGVPDLRGHIREAVRRREAAVRRARGEVTASARRLREEVGDGEPDPGRSPAGRHVVEALVDAAGVPAVLDAVTADHRRRAAGYVGWPFTRWARRLRPDPLRRLRLGTAGPDLARLTRSSLPAPGQAQRARVELATRRVGQEAAAGLPRRWADAVRTAAAPPPEDLADALDQAVTGVDLERRTPAWWRVAGMLQVLLAGTAVVGALWLAALFVVAWLRLPEPPVPELEGMPWPTVLLLGGLLGGLLLSVLGRALAGLGARRHRRRVGRAMNEAVAEVARERVLAPVLAVLADHRRAREALERALGRS